MNKRERTFYLRGQHDFLDEAFRRAASRYGSEEGPALIGIREGHEPTEDLQFEEHWDFRDADNPLERKVTGDRDLLIGIMGEAIDAQFDALISYRESTRQYREAEASQEMGLSVDSPSLYEPSPGFGSPRYDFYSKLRGVTIRLYHLIDDLLTLERFECSECDELTWQVGIAECPKCGAPYLDQTGP